MGEGAESTYVSRPCHQKLAPRSLDGGSAKGRPSLQLTAAEPACGEGLGREARSRSRHFPVRVLVPLWTFVVSGVRADCLRQVNDRGTVCRVRLVAFDQLVTSNLFADRRPQDSSTAPVNDVDAPQPGKRSLV